ncbi:ATP-binding cassette, subfamily B [Chitinophaga rupis]|uniref:ATP-binding cassette, subfamily B n=2 Tax=Chitinophaga rupis TaxID=573321 RepID=A0A1H7GU41_9BACT|nr:ATP-binding cassette, subfamily B [Chitinophaga rupis]
MDCGPACLRMVAKYHGRSIPLEWLRNSSQYGKTGVSMLGLAEAAESIGLKSIGARLTFEQLINEVPLPAILHWKQYHFVVLTPASSEKKLVVADPADGLLKLNKQDFLKYWLSVPPAMEETEQAGKGMVLLLEPTPHFENPAVNGDAQVMQRKIGKRYLLSYLKEHRGSFFQVLLGLFISSMLQLLFPYLTQSIVDTGINTRDLTFIQIILAAQLMLLFSQTIVEFIRSRILLHISTRINISLLSTFWTKLLKLPLRFFDSKHPGDIMQRVNDHHRIESFLTGTALNTLFSVINLVVFLFVLLFYNTTIFFIFLTGSLLYLLWIRVFLKYRRQLDYQRFTISAKVSNATMQLVYGMPEIKLNNAENTYRWAWERLQAGLFKLNFKSLSLAQYQQMGAFFLNQGKNVLITFVVASLVIEGKLTLGMMLAIQYIIGQLNSPVEQLIGFTQQAQDAKISLERLNDIHVLEDEEPANSDLSHHLPQEHDISLKDLSFTYPGAGNEPVLKNINLNIPQGKVTAIVGMSGSGKTTLIKLLLRFYDNYNGDLFLGAASFKSISPKYWRSVSGAVMQDPFIFNDTIQKNITVTDDKADTERLQHACSVANILSFIESLPLGFNTRLGADGNAISGGQKQRLAIARAVYKNPRFLFFDEATNSLDANNEKVILENLQQFFKGKTVVVVAHRLSTVKNADKIVVMENGQIAEEGTHAELILEKGKYFKLIQNQLELGNG